MLIEWRDVWIGAAMTGIFFAIVSGRWVLYLGSGSAASAYGAASSLITLLLWVYYSSQILLCGAEFTQVYASQAGRWDSAGRTRGSGRDERIQVVGRPTQFPLAPKKYERVITAPRFVLEEGKNNER
jgi:uncharacterized BrkB/YihY/UPF0761 family membrane protein